MATEGSADFMGPVRPEYSAPTPSFTAEPPAWTHLVLRPSPTVAKVVATPPVQFNPSPSITADFFGKVQRASDAAKAEVVNVVQRRVENDVDIFKYLSSTPSNSLTFSAKDYLDGIYKNRATEQFENAEAAARKRNLPFISPERLIKPVVVLDAPAGKYTLRETEKLFRTRETGQIEAPLTQGNQVAFARATFVSKNKPTDPEVNPVVSTAVPAYAASSLSDFSRQVLEHETSHYFSYGSSAEREQFVEQMVKVVGVEPSSVAEDNNVPYPIRRPSEFAPAAGALQRYYASTNRGDRMDTPQKYNDWIKQFEGLNSQQIWKLNVPMEVKRALEYRLNPTYKQRIDRAYQFLLPATLARTTPDSTMRQFA